MPDHYRHLLAMAALSFTAMYILFQFYDRASWLALALGALFASQGQSWRQSAEARETSHSLELVSARQ